MPCSDPNAVGEACGGSQRLSVYALNPQFAQEPTTSPGSGSFPSLGCYSDNVGGRALPAQVDVGDGGLTVERCTAACAGQGFAIAGVEYGQGKQTYQLTILTMTDKIQSASVAMLSGSGQSPLAAHRN